MSVVRVKSALLTFFLFVLPGSDGTEKGHCDNEGPVAAEANERKEPVAPELATTAYKPLLLLLSFTCPSSSCLAATGPLLTHGQKCFFPSPTFSEAHKLTNSQPGPVHSQVTQVRLTYLHILKSSSPHVL